MTLKNASLLRDLDVKARSLLNQIALTRNGRINPKELAGKLEAEWLRIRADLKTLQEGK